MARQETYGRVLTHIWRLRAATVNTLATDLDLDHEEVKEVLSALIEDGVVCKGPEDLYSFI